MSGRDYIIVGDFNVCCGRLDATASMCFTSDSRKVLKDEMFGGMGIQKGGYSLEKKW